MDLWFEMYEEAKKFYFLNGHLNIPIDYCSNGYKVGYWISNQRVSYKNRFENSSNGRSIMSDERVKLLEDIGMVWDVRESDWLFNYERVKKFFLENGNINVSETFITSDGFKLGEWLKYQRASYRCRFSGKKSTRYGFMSDEHIKLLEDLGMIWCVRKKSWFDMYEVAKKYYLEVGNLNVSQNFIYDGVRLGAWVYCQCIAYRNRSLSKEDRYSTMAPLSDEYVALLEDIGIIWDKRIENWDFNFLKAKEFFLENGHLKVPSGYVTSDGVRLGCWIRNQRVAFNNTCGSTLSRLRAYQISKLESIGMIWNINSYKLASKPFECSRDKVEKMFLEFLSDYVKENKSTFDSYDDVLKITNLFIEMIGSKENHYKPFTKLKK